MRPIRLAAAIAVPLWGAVIPAYAALQSNAITLNALTSNAVTSNALNFNALTSNALSINGLTLNSLSFNALTSNALTSKALSQNPLRPSVPTQRGSAVSDLNGVAVEAVSLPPETHY